MSSKFEEHVATLQLYSNFMIGLCSGNLYFNYENSRLKLKKICLSENEE